MSLFGMSTNTTTPPTVAKVQVEPKPVQPKTIQQRIQEELPRRTGQYLRATHVANDSYRVNWYEPDQDPNCVVTVNRIASSKFLRVTLDDSNELVVEDQTITVDNSSDTLAMFL